VVCPALGGVTFDRGALAGAVARGVRGHVLVGAQDEAVGAVREACELLNDVGVRTTLDVVDGVAHDYPTDFDVRLTSALASLLDGA
jgi:hypothetical protein